MFREPYSEQCVLTCRDHYLYDLDILLTLDLLAYVDLSATLGSFLLFCRNLNSPMQLFKCLNSSLSKPNINCLQFSIYRDKDTDSVVTSHS